MSLLDNVPESVYRVCDLLVAVMQRNGVKWQEDTLAAVFQEVNFAKDILL